MKTRKVQKVQEGGASGPEMEAHPTCAMTTLAARIFSLGDSPRRPLFLLPAHAGRSSRLLPLSTHQNSDSPRQSSRAWCTLEQCLAHGSLPCKHFAEHKKPTHSGHAMEGTTFRALTHPQTKHSAKTHTKTMIQHDQSRRVVRKCLP